MVTPFRLKVSENFSDPLSSDRCEIEQHIVDYYEPIGGYYQLDIDNLPAISCSEAEHSYGKILKVLGIAAK